VGSLGKSVVGTISEEIVDAFLAYFASQRAVAFQGNTEEPPLENPSTFLWALYSQMDRFPGTLPEDGALLDQPFLLMVELSAVALAAQINQRQVDQQNNPAPSNA